MLLLIEGGSVGGDVRVGAGDGEERVEGVRLGGGASEEGVDSCVVVPLDTRPIEKPIKAVNVADSSKTVKILLSFLFMSLHTALFWHYLCSSY